MRLSSVIISLCLSLSACGDDDSKPADTTAADTTAADTSAPETVEETATPDTTADTTPAKVDAACSEQGYTDCFHNGDCEASERCENMSANDVQIPCCVTGARGTADAGVACVNENDCASALCISMNDGPFLCSKVCQDDSECPPAAAKCSAIGACVPAN